MMRELEILDPGEPSDLFCLQAVFTTRLQKDLDRFRHMWNAHKIRGRRTVNGHGGGVPLEMWFDPVQNSVARDDAVYSGLRGTVSSSGVDDGSMYGVAEPFKNDTVELAVSKLNAVDPLGGDNVYYRLLRTLREAYFEQVTFESDTEGVQEYIEFKRVSAELSDLAPGGFLGADGVADWDGYGASGADAEACRIRAVLARLGKGE